MVEPSEMLDGSGSGSGSGDGCSCDGYNDLGMDDIVAAYVQEHDAWCWVAASMMIIQYNLDWPGDDSSVCKETIECYSTGCCNQCNLFNFVMSVGEDCCTCEECSSYDFNGNALEVCGQGGTFAQLLDPFDFTAENDNGSLTYEDIITEINNGNPIGIVVHCTDPDNVTSHALVIFGYSCDMDGNPMIAVGDPYDGSSTDFAFCYFSDALQDTEYFPTNYDGNDEPEGSWEWVSYTKTQLGSS